MPTLSKHASEGSLLLSAQVPPPGTYDVRLLPDGNKVEQSTNSNVLFTKGSVPNFIEAEERIYKDNPGPGTYEHPQPGRRGTRTQISSI